ncbi:hypothetical protein CAT7_04839 [Carnobacterium sp. AT7]|uniref:hypothetical protein n=1 Tax=Carnobacterium sp. AT7 TaxID=333990 RepID=UPI00015F19DA|nr:hypothetical protein [Carnobacterium sp. AT7]EDP68564.1 hypothetical protein CAT7_04839 [Carnobacterium sp. AT7]
MNIIIDLGNLWEMLGALGTLFAVVVSLWLALRDEKKELRLQAKVIPINPNNIETNHLHVSLLNTGSVRIKIVEVGIIQKGQEKITRDLFINNLCTPPFFIDEHDDANYRSHVNKIKLAMDKKGYSPSKHIRVFVKDNSGKIYYSKKIKIFLE